MFEDKVSESASQWFQRLIQARVQELEFHAVGAL